MRGPEAGSGKASRNGIPAPEAERAHRHCLGCAPPRPLHSLQAAPAARIFLNCLPPGFKGSAQAVTGICRVNTLPVEGRAFRIPNVNWVLGPRPKRVGWRSNLRLTLLGSRANAPLRVEGIAGCRLTPPLCEPRGARGPVGGALPKLHPPPAPSWERNHIPFTLGASQGAVLCLRPSWQLVRRDRWAGRNGQF